MWAGKSKYKPMKLASLNDRYIKREDLKQTLIVLLMLVIAAGTGFLAAKVDQTLWVVIAACVPISLIGLFWVTRHLSAMPILILFTAIFIPLAVPTGTLTLLADSMILAGILGAAWLFYRISSHQKIATMDPQSRWLIVFMAVPFLSLVWSNLLRDPFLITQPNFLFVQGATAVVMVLLPLVLLLTANTIKSEGEIKALVAVMLIGGVPGFLSENGVFPWPIATRGMFTLWVVSIAASLILFNRKTAWPMRVFLAGLTAVWIHFRFIQYTIWVSGWLPAFVAFGVMAFLKSKKLFLGLLIGGLMIVLINFQYFSEMVKIKTNISGLTRLSAWKTSLNLVAEHPIFGTGPGGYLTYYRSYNLGDEAMNATHNNYLDMFAELGVIGFVPFIGFFTAITVLGYRLCRRMKGRGDFLEAATMGIFAGMIACLIAMGMGDWLIPFPYTQGIGSFDYEVYSWIFMGALLAIDRMTKSKQSTQTEST
jgi:O-antigen ligase